MDNNIKTSFNMNAVLYCYIFFPKTLLILLDVIITNYKYIQNSKVLSSLSNYRFIYINIIQIHSSFAISD